MSEGTTKPNGSREEMNIVADSKKVAKKIEKFGIEFTGVIVQFSERKLRAAVVEENGDPINRPNDFVLAANPKTRVLDKNEILEGNKANARGFDKKSKKPTKQGRKDSQKESKNTETGR